MKNRQTVEIYPVDDRGMVRNRKIDYNKVEELYNLGMTQAEIARSLNTDRRNISRIVRHHIKDDGFDPEILSMVLDLRQQGLSLIEINSKIGTPISTLGNIISVLQTRGCLPTNKDMIAERNAKIRQQFSEDISVVSISEEHGLSPVTVLHICNPPNKIKRIFEAGVEAGYKKAIEEMKTDDS